MSDQQIDYDALENQARQANPAPVQQPGGKMILNLTPGSYRMPDTSGGVDYDALENQAKQHTHNDPGVVDRFWNSMVNAVNPLPSIEQWWDRTTHMREDNAAIMDGLSVGLKARGRQMTPQEQQIFDKAQKAMARQDTGDLVAPSIPPMAAPIPGAAMQAVKGDIAGAAGTLTGAYVVPALVGTGAKILTGKLAPPEPGAPAGPASPQYAKAQQVIGQGEQFDVPLSAGDISLKPSLQNMETSLEEVPGVGMRKFRQAQQDKIKAAGGRLQERYSQALIDTDSPSLAELEDAARAGDERAKNVYEKMMNAGNDPDRILQASIGLADWDTRQTATKLYDRVQNLAEQHNLGDVPMDSTTKALRTSLQQLLPAKLKNTEVIRLAQQVLDSISPKQGEGGNTVAPDNSYGLIRQLHSDLGDRIREYYQGNNALIGEKGVGYLERVQNAIEDDLRNYAQNSNVPEIIDAGRQADQYYKTSRVPFKNGMLASAAVSTEPDQIFQQFIKSGKGDRAQSFYTALDDRGRAAVRFNMINKAVEDSINPQNGIFSPQKFFTSVEKLKDAYGVFFSGSDQAEINGFKNLMAHVTRAGQFAENPPTGKRVIPYLMGGGAATAGVGLFTHPWVTVGGLAGFAGLAGMARALFTTPGGRNLLLRMSGIKPGTPIMSEAWQKAAAEMPRLTVGLATTQPPKAEGSEQ